MKKKTIKCPYCGGAAILRDASYVYGADASGRKLYVCQHYPTCDAYVSVHHDTLLPRGTLANGELRQKRIETHRIFDLIWKQGILTKKNAYRWIRDKFALTESQAHIGCFSMYMCDRLIEESRKVLMQNTGKSGGNYCG